MSTASANYSLKRLLLLVTAWLLIGDPSSVVNAFGTRLWRRIRGKNASTFQDLLLGRRTINAFQDTLPDHWEEALNEAIQAATYAPNHKRTEPWRFHLLGPESVRKVCELNAKLVTEKKGPAAGEKKLQRWLGMPGWLVVTCKRQPEDDKDATSMLQPMSLAREDYAACCCAVQNLCLSLHANKLGTKWTTGHVNFDKGFSDAVGFSMDDEYVVGTIWFGAPLSTPSSPPKKLSINDVLIRHA